MADGHRQLPPRDFFHLEGYNESNPGGTDLSYIESLAWSPLHPRGLLAAGTVFNTYASVWDLGTGRVSKLTWTLDVRVVAMAFSGRVRGLLAILGTDNMVRLLDVETERLVQTLDPAIQMTSQSGGVCFVDMPDSPPTLVSLHPDKKAGTLCTWSRSGDAFERTATTEVRSRPDILLLVLVVD